MLRSTRFLRIFLVTHFFIRMQKLQVTFEAEKKRRKQRSLLQAKVSRRKKKRERDFMRTNRRNANRISHFKKRFSPKKKERNESVAKPTDSQYKKAYSVCVLRQKRSICHRYSDILARQRKQTANNFLHFPTSEPTTEIV